MDKIFVIGNPIAHSQSPRIHRMFADQLGLSLQSEKTLIQIDAFVPTMKQLYSHHLKGASITLPFKQAALSYVDQTTKRASEAQAVNIIKYNDDGSTLGDNTDGIGLVTDIQQNLHWEMKNKTILIIGAGGAVRGILPALLACHPKNITLINRTTEKAFALSKLFASLGAIQVLDKNDPQIPQQHFDFVINGTSSSLFSEIPSFLNQINFKQTHCYDLAYTPDITPFCQFAKEKGAHTYTNGFGMLVESQAYAFKLWYDKMPSTKKLITQAR